MADANTYGLAARKTDNSGDKPLNVPGFGCPLDFELDITKRYIHALDGVKYPKLAAREVAMIQFMGRLTEKQDWRKKAFDEGTVAKWREEAKNAELISEKAFEWCITELRDKATEERFTITLDGGARCVKADGLLSEQLHDDLNAGVRPILHAPGKKWLLNSSERVLDHLDPSMYPLVYGKTRVLQSGQVKLDDILEARNDTFIAPLHTKVKWKGGGHTRWIEDWSGNPYASRAWSKKYQWLPCEVAFAGRTGSEVKITSYINNLPHRGHEKLYECIEKLIGVSVPLWNEVLEVNRFGTHQHLRAYPRIVTQVAEKLDRADLDWLDKLPRSKKRVSPEEWDKAVSEVTEYLKLPDIPENLRSFTSAGTIERVLPEDWMNEWGLAMTAGWKFDYVRRTLHPEPFHCSTYEDWKHGESRQLVAGVEGVMRNTEKSGEFGEYGVALHHTFRERGLQVIVKLASIELTPEEPSYDGSGWVVDGIMNEHIIAMAIYFFNVENVTESHIRFRQNVQLGPVGGPQDGPLPLEIIASGLGFEHNNKQTQELGSIITTQGRLIVFPNTRQRKFDPFELVDKNKAGHKRFIVLWLVDPCYRILSTRNVPPQQYDWWKEKAAQSVPAGQPMPAEIQDLINEELKEGLMTIEEAKQIQLEMLEERILHAFKRR